MTTIGERMLQVTQREATRQQPLPPEAALVDPLERAAAALMLANGRRWERADATSKKTHMRWVRVVVDAYGTAPSDDAIAAREKAFATEMRDAQLRIAELERDLAKAHTVLDNVARQDPDVPLHDGVREDVETALPLGPVPEPAPVPAKCSAHKRSSSTCDHCGCSDHCTDVTTWCSCPGNCPDLSCGCYGQPPGPAYDKES
jgi:hypothetical protein